MLPIKEKLTFKSLVTFSINMFTRTSIHYKKSVNVLKQNTTSTALHLLELIELTIQSNSNHSFEATLPNKFQSPKFHHKCTTTPYIFWETTNSFAIISAQYPSTSCTQVTFRSVVDVKTNPAHHWWCPTNILHR